MVEYEMHQGVGDELHLVPAHEVHRHWLGRGCYCKPRLDGLIWHHHEIAVEMPGQSSILTEKPAGALKLVGGTDTAP